MSSIIAAGTLAYGIQLPVQAQSTIFVESWEVGAGVDELAAVARVADETGFLYVAVCDHVAISDAAAAAMSTEWWDTIATLSYLAAVTERVRLLSHVYVLPYRHPLVTAKAWMTLDALSKGRAILGVGAGHLASEFEVLGIDFDRRGALLDEAIDAVRATLIDERPVHEGAAWSFSGHGQRPRPVQERVPIWVGGSSAAAMRRAAERGDGWLPQGPPAVGMAEGIKRIVEHRHATVGDEPIDLGALSGSLYVGEPAWDVGRAVTGPPARIAAYLRSYADMGANHVQVRFRSRDLDEQLDQMRAFAADVAPLLEG